LADLPFGILWLLAMSGLGLYGVLLAGWASGSKYPLLGSVRASAQLLSYEAALGLAIVGVLVHSGTLSTRAIVNQQSWQSWDSFVTEWYWLPAIGAFVIFVISAIAETNHPPFDLVEAEQELVGGFNTEYSSIRFALFFLAEFMNVITMSAIIVTLFLGGPQPLWINEGSWLGDRMPDAIVGLDIFGWAGPFAGTLWVILKVLAFLYVYVWFRATLPRLRYDQLMDFGWKLLIPVALGWLLVLTAIQLGRDEDWNVFAVVAACLAALGASYLLFSVALGVSRRNREREGAAY
jgi:NADH-quinone oxidoreductase subunit H